MAVKMMHCANDRANKTEIYMETRDGRFKYRLYMDFMKNQPEEYALLPFEGGVNGVDCDAEGNVYVGVVGGDPFSPPLSCVVKMDSDGNYLGTVGKGVVGPVGAITVTNHGTIMLPQTGANFILEIDAVTGQPVGRIGEPGKSNGNTSDKDIFTKVRLHRGMFPTEPAAGYSGGLYEQLLKFNATELGGPFNGPTDCAFDTEGNCFVSDGTGNFAVHKFDKDGNYVCTWGGKGVFDPYTDTPGKFVRPNAVCVDKENRVWVCDREKDAIHVFDAEGNVVFFCSQNLGQPTDVATDGEYVYVMGRAGYLTIFDAAFEAVGTLGVFDGNLRASRMGCDSKGNLYITPNTANPDHQIIALKRI